MSDRNAPVSDAPETFLASLGADLAAEDGGDAELAAILACHLLKVDPAPDGVAAARQAIFALAAERASRKAPGVHDG